MKVSTRGRYGLRAMVDLAVHANGGHVALFSIAERQGISINYLEQVFSMLKKARLVRSVKGAGGGYVLSGNPAAIKVGTILRALEGDLSVIDEKTGGAAEDKTGVQNCIKANVWDKMNSCLNELVDTITLEELAENYKEKCGFDTIMYYI